MTAVSADRGRGRGQRQRTLANEGGTRSCEGVVTARTSEGVEVLKRVFTLLLIGR